MPLNNPHPAMPRTGTKRDNADPGTHSRPPHNTIGHIGGPPMTEGAASSRSAAEAWAAESGMPLSAFQRVYFEQCVADTMDQNPALRQVDAERLALTQAPWLDDRAA